VLQSHTVYSNVSKGVLAKNSDLGKAFGHDDHTKICLEVKGKYLLYLCNLFFIIMIGLLLLLLLIDIGERGASSGWEREGFSVV